MRYLKLLPYDSFVMRTPQTIRVLYIFYSVLIGLAEGELQDPEVQKSALNIIINCVCGPVERVGLMQYLLYTYMTQLLLLLLLILCQSIGEGRQLLACSSKVLILQLQPSLYLYGMGFVERAGNVKILVVSESNLVTALVSICIMLQVLSILSSIELFQHMFVLHCHYYNIM